MRSGRALGRASQGARFLSASSRRARPVAARRLTVAVRANELNKWGDVSGPEEDSGMPEQVRRAALRRSAPTLCSRHAMPRAASPRAQATITCASMTG